MYVECKKIELVSYQTSLDMTIEELISLFVIFVATVIFKHLSRN